MLFGPACPAEQLWACTGEGGRLCLLWVTEPRTKMLMPGSFSGFNHTPAHAQLCFEYPLARQRHLNQRGEVNRHRRSSGTVRNNAPVLIVLLLFPLWSVLSPLSMDVFVLQQHLSSGPEQTKGSCFKLMYLTWPECQELSQSCTGEDLHCAGARDMAPETSSLPHGTKAGISQAMAFPIPYRDLLFL